MSTDLGTGRAEAESQGYPQGPFVASRSKKKFHTLTCMYAVSLHAGNSPCFETRGDAIATGRKPCGTCYS